MNKIFIFVGVQLNFSCWNHSFSIRQYSKMKLRSNRKPTKFWRPTWGRARESFWQRGLASQRLFSHNQRTRIPSGIRHLPFCGRLCGGGLSGSLAKKKSPSDINASCVVYCGSSEVIKQQLPGYMLFS